MIKLKILSQYCLITLLTISFSVLSAQESTKSTEDAELWTSISLSKEFMDDFELSLKEAVRFDNNISDLKVYFSQLGLKYKIIKGLTVTGKYRYSNDEDGDDSHRIMGEIGYRYKPIKRMSIAYRLRMEQEYEDSNSSEQRYRNRLQCKYLPKKSDFSASISAESFYSKDYQFSDFEKWRYAIGLQYEITKELSLELGYILQRPINSPHPENDYIIDVGIGYQL